MSEILFKNGLIVDGSGEKAFKGHVLVSGETITTVAGADTEDGKAILNRDAHRTIDASGLVLAPGFIDAHSHFDWMLPLPDHEFLHPMLEQGITTVVTGNCGFSPAPLRSDQADQVNAFAEFCLERPLDFEWEGMRGFMDFLDRQPMLFNNAQLLGHGGVHMAAVEEMMQRPDKDELAGVADKVRDELDTGVFGLSLGLMYPPGIFYAKEDLTALAGAAAEKDLILTVHTRALSKYSNSYPIIPFLGKPHNLKALEEMLDIALETGVKLQISHLIFAGRKSWGTAEKAVRMIEKARDRGVAVMWDVYPHFCGNSYLNVFLPPWFQANLADNLENSKAVKRMRFELKMAAKLLGFNMADIQIMQAGFAEGERYEGLNLAEIGEKEGLDVIATLTKLIKESDGKALQLTWGYSGDDNNEWVMQEMLAHDLCLFETDTILKSSGFPNPASYGAFPRILGRFVREKKSLSLEDAVSKMSGKTARWFGMEKCGEIKPGFAADIVLFNPDTIADNTTRADTARRPSGIETVFINGEMVVENGTYIGGKKNGRMLRHS